MLEGQADSPVNSSCQASEVTGEDKSGCAGDISRAADSKGYRYKFTVFSPAYNRRGTIHRVYDSLCKQTLTDFEWVVVDDGSTDGTSELVETWQKEAPFPIRLFVQRNQGKHVATNLAVAESDGEFFLTLDSDDACLPNALEHLSNYWNSISAEFRHEFAGVTVNCQDQNGKLVGNLYPQSPLDTNTLDLHYKYKVHGEKWGFVRTNVMREFPFPVDLVSSFVPEDIVWNEIGRKYKTRFVNDILRTYFVEDSNGSLVHSAGRQKRNAPSWRKSHLSDLNRNIMYASAAPRIFLMHALFYSRTSFHMGIGIIGQYRDLNNTKARLLWLTAVIPAAMIWLNDVRTSR